MIGDGDLIGAAIVLGVLLAVIALGELWARLGSPQPEHSRKFVHLGSGAACLLFPLLIESPLVVGVMAVAMSAFFGLADRFQWLTSIYGVERSSKGSEYYALAIFFLFLLAGDDLWIYFSSVLILGVADAFAALIGIRYGKVKYRVQDGQKSLEGSLAFFAIAFVAVLIPAPFFAQIPWSNLLHIAFAAAALLTCFEAISMRGSDNLFVPVAAAVMLDKLAADAFSVLLFQNLHLVAIFIGLFLINAAARQTTISADEAPFDTGGLMTFALFFYGTWALGSSAWALPVMVGFFLAVTAWIASTRLTGVEFSIPVRPTYRALLLPFGVLLAANVSGAYTELFGPYLAVGAAVLAFTVISLWRPNPEVRGPLYSTRLSAAVGLGAAIVIVVPAYYFYPEVGPVGPLTIIGATALISALNLRIVERRRRHGDDFVWPASHLFLALALGAGIFLAQYNGILPAWNPPLDAELMRYEWTPWW